MIISAYVRIQSIKNQNQLLDVTDWRLMEDSEAEMAAVIRPVYLRLKLPLDEQSRNVF